MIITKDKRCKEIGQYFTAAPILQDFVFNSSRNKDQRARLLEPSFGAGHLLAKFLEYDADYPMVCCEIDDKIKPIVSFGEHQKIMYCDFLKQRFAEKFKLIIGNPPFVKQAGRNLYLVFIEECFNLLDDGGELIFIVPSEFLKQTSAARIISAMVREGRFTDFLFPHDEKLFKGASIDVVAFRYVKDGQTSPICHVRKCANEVPMIYNALNGIITFREIGEENNAQMIPISNLFSAYVGLVSGCDRVFRGLLGDHHQDSREYIDVLNGSRAPQPTKVKFIFVTKFPTENDAINVHLLANKMALLARKIRKFNETNWFEWGAPRNYAFMRDHCGEPCIYVRNMTRNKEVAFLGEVQYFGGSLLCLHPAKNATASARACATTIADMRRVVTYLNTAEFQRDYDYAGRFKIGQRQLLNAMIPAAN